MYGIVYLVTNKVNGKQYVGMTSQNLEDRWYYHCRGKNKCRLLGNAINKYGHKSFIIEELASCKTFEDLKATETYLIEYLNTMSPNGYNLTNGGHVRGISSQETKDLISKSGYDRYSQMTSKERKESCNHLLAYIHPKKPCISFNISTGKLTKYNCYFDTRFDKDMNRIIKDKGTRGNCYWFNYNPELPDSHYIEESMKRLDGRLWTENEKPIKSINLTTGEEKIYNNIFETFKEGYSNSSIRKALTGVIDSTGGCSWHPVGYEIPKITRVLTYGKGKKFSDEHKASLSKAAKTRKCTINPGMKLRTPHITIDGIDHKKCNKCQEVLALDAFTTENKRWDKKSTTCRKCYKLHR